MNWPSLDSLISKTLLLLCIDTARATVFLQLCITVHILMGVKWQTACSLDGQLRSLEASIATADPATQQLFSQSTALWLQQQQREQQQH